jgi:hypothetical protein
MTTPPNWDIDKRLVEYATALETHDWATFSVIWNEAGTNPELEQALREFHEGLLEEQELDAEREAGVEAVQQVIAACFPDRPAPFPDILEPLKTRDVALQLQSELTSGTSRMTEADKEANQALLNNDTTLPDQLKLPVFEEWCDKSGIKASQSYWRLFRQAALKLTMSRSQQHARLLAAREQTPKPKGKRPHE